MSSDDYQKGDLVEIVRRTGHARSILTKELRDAELREFDPDAEAWRAFCDGEFIYVRPADIVRLVSRPGGEQP